MMNIINDTPLEVTAMPMEIFEGCPVLTVVVKGTFDIIPGGRAFVSEQQMPILFVDEYYDDMGAGSVKFETDMVPFKPRTDIVLVGKAHAPGGRSVQVLDVMLRVGHIKKIIRVFGDRVWRSGGRLSQDEASTPMPFSTMDLVYERAYGGIDMERGGYCPENLIGRGYVADVLKKPVDGVPLPNLEDPQHLITSWKDHPRPVGFGFYGRGWMPRLGFMMEHEEKEEKKKMPESMDDLVSGHYNGAHPDLQVDGYLNGDEEVELVNLSPEGNLQFRLPGTKVYGTVTRIPEREEAEEESLTVSDDDNGEQAMGSVKEDITFEPDTLCIIPDETKIFIIWRGLCPVTTLDTEEIETIHIH